MNVPGRHHVERKAGGCSALDGRGGVAGADGDSAPATYRVRLVYEVEGCSDPLDALIALIAAVHTDMRIRLVDSGVI